MKVRTPYWGDITSTDLSIPCNEISAHLDELPDDKDTKVVLYCSGDAMSTIATDGLVWLG